MIVKTDAIVLRARKFRETSTILNFYTREFGKLSVIAKGARGSRSRFGSSLQPLNHVNAVLYKHDRRELHLLSQCETVGRFRSLSEDLEKFAAAMSVVEMIERVAHDEERNEALFELVLGVLTALDAADRNVSTIQYYFELRLSDVLGFRPNLDTCLSCGEELDEQRLGTKGGELRLGNGGVLCGACSASAGIQGRITSGALKILQRLQAAPGPDTAARVKLDSDQQKEVKAILLQHLQAHVGGLGHLRARSLVPSLA
jgi:DNA repair protein RecO (recombination protein O)